MVSEHVSFLLVYCYLCPHAQQLNLLHINLHGCAQEIAKLRYVNVYLAQLVVD